MTFFDASVPDTNGTDVVIHQGAATSPPDDADDQQFYVHHHQIDHKLVLHGSRCFTLLNPQWNQPHHVVQLEERAHQPQPRARRCSCVKFAPNPAVAGAVASRLIR